MTTTLPDVAAAYVRATNNHDSAKFIALFAGNAVVNDAGREFRGLAAISACPERESTCTAS
jgi:hypothetical protein